MLQHGWTWETLCLVKYASNGKISTGDLSPWSAYYKFTEKERSGDYHGQEGGKVELSFSVGFTLFFISSKEGERVLEIDGGDASTATLYLVLDNIF